MRIGFTGTRLGMTDAQRVTFSGLIVGVTVFHHGDCVGADADAHAIVRKVAPKAVVYAHPGQVRTLRAYSKADTILSPIPFLARNRVIVDSTDWLVATPEAWPLPNLGGTAYTIRYAQSRGGKVTIIWPDGTIGGGPHSTGTSGIVTYDTGKVLGA